MRSSSANLVRARAAAFKIWTELGHPHPKEVPLTLLAASRKVFVHNGAMRGAEGRLIRKNGKGIIRVGNSALLPGRQRFTIAHELGHWELHKGVSQFICDDEDMRDYGRSPMEMEANHFAAELLMPTFHFREACGRGLPSFDLIGNLADEFQTTLTATAIRYADVTHHRVIVVWVFGGKVMWSYSKPENDLPYVMANRAPPDYSSATLEGNDIADGLDHYDDADWFPELRFKSEVLEVTKRMPRLNAGLTLLYLP